jgi:hypothetical protein
MDARNRKQGALTALRSGGVDVLRVVEGVVLNAASLTAIGQARSPHKKAALAWAGLALEIGLHLLEAHYRSSGRLTGGEQTSHPAS